MNGYIFGESKPGFGKRCGMISVVLAAVVAWMPSYGEDGATISSAPAAKGAPALPAFTTMHAFFTQTSYDDSGEVLDEAQGQLWLKKPNKLYWQSDSDQGQQRVVSDGRTLWQYDVELAQVMKQRFDQLAANNPLAILTEPFSAIHKHYLLQGKQVIGPDTWMVTLVPKDLSGQVDHVDVRYQNKMVSMITVYDRFGGRVVLSLSKMMQGVEVPDDRFTFTVPEGVDVIDASDFMSNDET